jgi:hypothetical protein
MPIIPRTREGAQLEVGSPVPIAGTTDARIQGEAMASLGSAMADFGAKQLQFDRSLKYQEGSDVIKSTVYEGHNYAKRTAKSDGSDYAQKLNEYTRPKIDQAMNKYASNDPRLKKQLGSFLTSAYVESNSTAMINSAQMREEDNYRRLEKVGDDAATRQLTNPSEQMLISDLRSLGATVDKAVTSGAMSAENAEKARNVFYEKSAKGYIEGLATQQRYGKALAFLTANQEDPDLFSEIEPQQAKELGLIDSREADGLMSKGEKYKVPVMSNGDKIKLTPEMTAISRSLSPRDRANFIDQMKAKVKEATAIRLADLNANINGFQQVALSGGSYSEADVAGVLNDINSAVNMTLPAKARAMDAVRSADAINKQLKLVASTPRSQWDSLLSGADKKMALAAEEAAKYDPRMGSVSADFAVQANRAEHRQKLELALVAMAKEQEKDPVKFVVENDTTLATLYQGTRDGDATGTLDYVRASLAKQQYLGIPANKQKILAADEVTTTAEELRSIGDAKTTSDYLKGLEQKYGVYFPRVMDELSASDKNLSGFKYATYANDANRVKIIDAIKNKGPIEDTFKKLPSADYKQNLINQNIAGDVLADVNKVFTQSDDSNGVAQLQGLTEAIQLQIKRDAIRGSTIEEATKQARFDFIDSTYHVVETSKSNILVPKSMGGHEISKKIVQSYVGVYSQAENFKELNVDVPKNFAGQESEYYSRLEEDSAWVMNPEGSGVRLVARGLDGRLKPVTDKYKKPIERSFVDINMNPGKKTLDQSRGFLGKLFGGL